MIIDLLDPLWIAAIGPNRVSRILAQCRSETPEWLRTVYRDLTQSTISPLPIYTTTALGNRFISTFAFLPGLAGGAKLIASHPSNLDYNNQRAHSLISLCTAEGPDEKEAGKPFLVIDSAEITTTRTALGALLLLPNDTDGYMDS